MAKLTLCAPAAATLAACATHVLDGLLYHESELRIEEHYTDTAGFADHVFALCHFLGFEFAPRIADLADKNLCMPGKSGDWPALSSLIGGSISRKLVEREFDDVVRLAASIQRSSIGWVRFGIARMKTSATGQAA